MLHVLVAYNAFCLYLPANENTCVVCWLDAGLLLLLLTIHRDRHCYDDLSHIVCHKQTHHTVV